MKGAILFWLNSAAKLNGEESAPNQLHRIKGSISRIKDKWCRACVRTFKHIIMAMILDNVGGREKEDSHPIPILFLARFHRIHYNIFNYKTNKQTKESKEKKNIKNISFN